MENDTQSIVQYEDEIDLRELFGVLWREKKKIIGITSCFAIFSVLLAFWLPKQYTALVVLAPAQQETGGLSGALGQLGGLASLAGVDIGARESSESKIAQEVMRSWSFIDAFIVKNKLAVEIYAGSRWREEENELAIDDDLDDVDTQQWLIEDDDTGGLRPPTSWELFEKFQERLSVSEDKLTGLVSVSIEYVSPYIAKEWVDLYVKAINTHMQVREVNKVNRNIDYLQNQIAKTAIAEMQEVLYTLVEEQIKEKMVAEASPDYAFLIVSPSMLPEEKSKPNRALICVLGILVGGMLSVLLVLVTHYAGRSDKQ